MTFCKKWTVLWNYFEVTQTCTAGPVSFPRTRKTTTASECGDSHLGRSSLGLYSLRIWHPKARIADLHWPPCSESTLFQGFQIRDAYCVQLNSGRTEQPHHVLCVISFSLIFDHVLSSIAIHYSFFNLLIKSESELPFHLEVSHAVWKWAAQNPACLLLSVLSLGKM